MAQTVGVLSIDLVGNIGGFEKSMRRANVAANEFSRKLSVNIRNTHAELLRLAGPLVAAMSLQQVANYAQEWTQLNNRLKLVTATNGELAQSIQSVYRISQTTGQSLEGVSTVYQRIAKNADTYGLSLKQVADITETVNKAVALSGASAGAASAGLLQFAQAMASGTLRGDELNSILEQIPTLAEAIARGMGVTVGQLRKLGADGKLPIDAVVAALQKSASYIDGQFKTVTLTAAQEWQRFTNALEQSIGVGDEVLGMSSSVAKGLQGLTSYAEGLGREFQELNTDIEFFGQQINNIGANVAGAFGPLTDALSSFSHETNATATVFGRSFGQVIEDTLSDFQYWLNIVTGVFTALGDAASAVVDNIQIAFGNGFTYIKARAVEFINFLIEKLNQLGNVEVFGQKVGINLKTLDPIVENYKEFTKIAADFKYKNGGGLFNFADDLRVARQLNQAISDNVIDAEKYLSADEKIRQIDRGSKGVTAAPTGSKKKTGRAGKSDAEKSYEREQKAYEKWVRNQIEKIAMLGKETEYEQLLAEIQLGNYSKLTEAQRQNMLATAQMVDMAQDAYEVQKAYDDLIGKDMFKNHVYQVEALSKAWQNGALSLDAYTSRMNKLNLEGAQDRISRGVGSSTDMLQSILGEYTEGFTSSQQSIADAMSQSFTTLSDKAGDALGQILFYGDEANVSFSDIAKTIGVDLVSALTQMGIQMLAQKAIGSAINAASTAESVASGAAITSAMAPAAATASIATFGGASTAGLAGLLSVSSMLPTLFGKGFAEGGFTGSGGKYDPAGIVHAGEYVFNAQRVREIGLNNLQRLDKMGGFSEGGYVGRSGVSGSVASLSSGASTGELKLNIQTHTSKPLTFEESTTPTGERLLIVKEAVKMVAASMGNPNSDVSRALSKNTHTRRRF